MFVCLFCWCWCFCSYLLACVFLFCYQRRLFVATLKVWSNLGPSRYNILFSREKERKKRRKRQTKYTKSIQWWAESRVATLARQWKIFRRHASNPWLWKEEKLTRCEFMQNHQKRNKKKIESTQKEWDGIRLIKKQHQTNRSAEQRHNPKIVDYGRKRSRKKNPCEKK